MLSVKCRKSVFCVQFLAFFLLGTICGIWLYRCLAGCEYGWLNSYCALLGQGARRDGWTLLLTWGRPLVLAWLASIHPVGFRALPVLIWGRGLLTAYSACACLRAGLSPGTVILRGLVLLPLFYWLCSRASDGGDCHF